MTPIIMGLSREAPLTPGQSDTRSTGTAWGYSSSGYNTGGDTFAVVNANTVWTGHIFVLNVPKGATITGALFTPYAINNNNWNGNAADLTVGFEQADNPSLFSSNANANSRRGNRGTPIVWKAAGTGGAPGNGNPITGADLTAAVQAIVNRTGWVSGNNVQLITESIAGGVELPWRGVPTSGQEAKYPRLVVDYLA